MARRELAAVTPGVDLHERKRRPRWHLSLHKDIEKVVPACPTDRAVRQGT